MFYPLTPTLGSRTPCGWDKPYLNRLCLVKSLRRCRSCQALNFLFDIDYQLRLGGG